MGFSRKFTDQTYDCEITFESDGWSGEPVICDEGGPSGNTRFQFDITSRTTNNSDEYYTAEPSPGNYGYWHYAGSEFVGAILGISLEHMGRAIDTDGEIAFQGVGCHPNWGMAKCWGAKPSDTELIVRCNSIGVHSLDLDKNGEPDVYEDETLGRYFQFMNNMGIIFWRCSYNWSGKGTFRATIKTDLPIFETDADLLAYCQSGGTDTSKILNKASVDPEEEYILDQKYYFLHNIFTHNYHGSKTEYWRNYRWKPGYSNKIRMYRVEPTESRYYTLVLTVPSGLVRYKGPKGQYTDEDAFVVDQDTLQTHYCEYSFTISRVAPKDIMKVTDFGTNIPIFGNAADATKYANDELSIEDALNYSDIIRYENEIREPEWGTADAETETGVNGQTYAAGSAIYVMTRQQMTAFFTEIFKIQDPTFINAFKDGNVLFGDNQANAIIGCQYFPFDASLVCSLESSAGSIWVGGWESQNGTGKKVNFNDKTLSIGEFFMSDIFKDVRDYEPYTNLFVQLPYCGTYQLSIQKYLNKTVKIEYAVDIFTGACTALIFANNILMDSMDGMIGSQRPVTGRTAANMLSAITKGSGSVVAGAAGGIKAAGLAGGLGSVSSTIAGTLPAFGANVGGGAMIGGAHVAAAGTALGAAGVGLAGIGLAGAGAVAGVDAMYKAKNAYADPPMASRGQYSGNLGMFANQQVHFIVAIRHTIRPENELDLIGYPSGKSGKIGDFSGFLKSSAVYLADGFIGSAQERNEILEMIAKGIYI